MQEKPDWRGALGQTGTLQEVVLDMIGGFFRGVQDDISITGTTCETNMATLVAELLIDAPTYLSAFLGGSGVDSTQLLSRAQEFGDKYTAFYSGC